MRKDVIISITGCPDTGDGTPDAIELTTRGKLYRKNGKYFITYQETSLTGMEGVTTTVKLDGEQVILMRNGPVASHMVFQEGEKHWGIYQVEGQPMTVAVNAHKVAHTIDDRGGDLELDYSVEINHVLASHNLFFMRVRESSIDMRNTIQ